MENLHSSVTQNYLTRNGFIMVSNLLIDYQEELGITDLELNFIIKIMKNKPGFYIHDSDLDPKVCSKTLQRRRSSLKQKGILLYSIIKEQNPDTNTFVTKGISYDLSPLEEKLQKISNKIEERKQKEIKQEIKVQKLIVEETEDSPLSDYKKDFENYYGIPYVLNDYEINKYNSLSEENKKMLSYVFLYCKKNNLLENVVPRLSLFFKTSFRFTDLRRFCLENGYISDEEFKTVAETRLEQEEIEEESEFEKTQKDINRISLEIYHKYYENEKDNYRFLRAVERIVGRFYKDGQLPNIDFYINSAYESNGGK